LAEISGRRQPDATNRRVTFERDAGHWLFRLAPEEWIAAALSELARAESAFGERNTAAAYACLKRAAGMALNGVLILRPRDEWGRSYVQHLTALAVDTSAPELVQQAAARLVALKPATGPIVMLRTGTEERALIECARTVMAHAYAIVYKKSEEGT
jgi:hypothetical protein